MLCRPRVALAADPVDQNPPICSEYVEHGFVMSDYLFYCNNPGTSNDWFGCQLGYGGNDTGSCSGTVEYIGGISSAGDYTAEQCREVDALFQTLEHREGSFTYIAVFGMCMDFESFLNRAVLWGSVIGAGIALVRFGIGALQYSWSTGNPTKLESARETILYAVVGMLIIALTYVILELGSNFVPESWKVWFGV